MALNRVLGKKPSDVNKEILSGSLSDDLKLVSAAVAKRHLENIGKTIAQTVEKSAFNGKKSYGGRP